MPSIAARVDLLKLDYIKDPKAFLDSFETIQFYLWMPEFATGHADGSLVTDAANAEASRAWEGQLHLAIKNGILCFLFEIRGTNFMAGDLRCWQLSFSIVARTWSLMPLHLFCLYSMTFRGTRSLSWSTVHNLMVALLNFSDAR